MSWERLDQGLGKIILSCLYELTRIKPYRQLLSKMQTEEVIYVSKITTSSHKMQTHKWDLKVIMCESERQYFPTELVNKSIHI